MLSFISVPPRSLTPHRRLSVAASSPIFTQLAWRLVIESPSVAPAFVPSFFASACSVPAARMKLWRIVPSRFLRAGRPFSHLPRVVAPGALELIRSSEAVV